MLRHELTKVFSDKPLQPPNTKRMRTSKLSKQPTPQLRACSTESNPVGPAAAGQPWRPALSA